MAYSMGVTGLEPSGVKCCNDNELRRMAESGGALSGALPDKTAQFGPDLARVVEAWPRLSDAVKQDIIGMLDDA